MGSVPWDHPVVAHTHIYIPCLGITMLSRMVSRSLMSGQSPLMSLLSSRRAFAAAAVEKGEERVDGRLDGLMMTDDSVKPDQKKHAVIAYDMLEMYKKGVAFATINLWIDYYSGADVGSKHAIYNKSWARIDS